MSALASCLQRRSLVTRCHCKPSRRPVPFQSGSFAPNAGRTQRNVVAHFFKFGKNGMKSDDAGIYGSQGRNDYDKDDVEHYFNYMGMLAVDGSYDKLYKIVETGLHPVEILLLWACQENDAPKVQELLTIGDIDISVRNLEGKSPMEIATKPEILDLLRDYQSKRNVAA